MSQRFTPTSSMYVALLTPLPLPPPPSSVALLLLLLLLLLNYYPSGCGCCSHGCAGSTFSHRRRWLPSFRRRRWNGIRVRVLFSSAPQRAPSLATQRPEAAVAHAAGAGDVHAQAPRPEKADGGQPREAAGRAVLGRRRARGDGGVVGVGSLPFGRPAIHQVERAVLQAK